MKTNNKRQLKSFEETREIFSLHFDAHFNSSRFASKIFKSEADGCAETRWQKLALLIDEGKITFGVRD